MNVLNCDMVVWWWYVVWICHLSHFQIFIYSNTHSTSIHFDLLVAVDRVDIFAHIISHFHDTEWTTIFEWTQNDNKRPAYNTPTKYFPISHFTNFHQFQTVFCDICTYVTGCGYWYGCMSPGKALQLLENTLSMSLFIIQP